MSTSTPPATTPIGTTTSVEPQEVPPATDADNNFVVWAMLAAVAVLPFGFLIARVLNKRPAQKTEEKEEKNRCFDIKKMLDAKLKELTDLRGQLESKVQDAARDTLP